MEKMVKRIGRTAARTYCCMAEKTGKIAREMKLKSQMASNKAQIRELYEDIGKNVYEKHLLNENVNIKEECKDDCAMIDALANEIEDLRMEILNLNNLKQCPVCHYEIELDFTYCPNCGRKQVQTEESKQNDGPATIETTDKEDNILKKAFNKQIDEMPEFIQEDDENILSEVAEEEDELIEDDE